MNKRTLLIFLLAATLVFNFFSIASAATWEELLRLHFDQVDTFDSYPDWTGDAPDNGCVEHAWGGRWGYHCYYERTQAVCGKPRPTVLTNHGSDKVVFGKSIRLSHSGMGGLDCGECSTIRYYSGAGTQNSGYLDMYVFFRVYFPETLFPTWAFNDTDHTKRCYDNNSDQTSNPVVCHVLGKGYCDTDSWKWMSVSAGYIDANRWSELGITSNPCRYGVNENQFYIAGGASQNYEKRVVFYSPETGGTTWGTVDIRPYLGKLVGVEFHVRRESVIGSNDGLIEVWFYDEAGLPIKVFEAKNFQFLNPNSSCLQSLTIDQLNQININNMSFNRIMIESNKRLVNTLNYNGGNLYSSQGVKIGDMESVWYMDDFLVNQNRIGPTYYDMLVKPTNPKALIK